MFFKHKNTIRLKIKGQKSYLRLYFFFFHCLVAKSCLTFCDPMDYSPQGSSVHEILQARILEWVATSFSRGSSWPRDQTQVSSLQADSLPFESLSMFKILLLEYNCCTVCVSFCCTMKWINYVYINISSTTKWISYVYTNISSLLSLPSPPIWPL